MTNYVVFACFLVNAWLLIKAFIDDHRERKHRGKLDLYRRAELIGRRRLDHEPL